MSKCICPTVGIDGMHDARQKEFVAGFLKGLAEDGQYGKCDWNLLSLQGIYNNYQSLQPIKELVPFRGGACDRTRRCCGDCVRQCYTRCVQDCLHRLWLWNQMVENTPEAERNRIPLAIRLIVNQKFESHAHMSWCVGEILNQTKNTALGVYMKDAGLTGSSQAHPYRNNYAAAEELDPKTGRRVVNPTTFEIKLREWPESGLCPYCIPNVTIDRRRYKE